MRILGTALLVMFIMTLAAYGHGPAEWIAKGGYRNASGELCCGSHDCFVLNPADVSTTSNGDYYIRSLTEIVPRGEAQFSRDGDYWRCRDNATGKRRCFFVPPQGI